MKSVISVNSINELMKSKILVIICDEYHMPNSYILNFQNHFNQLYMLNLQSNISLPLKKNLWKNIIIQKILNQSQVIKIKDISVSKKLIEISNDVKSDDVTNREAVAAKLYFSTFEKKFTRRNDNIINSCLNYGYSIIRGCIARELVSFGFIPCMGIHHNNKLNNFNLADDLIEPLRFIVDEYVLNNMSNIDELNTSVKSNLIQLLNSKVMLGNDKYDLHYAIKLYIKSFKSSIEKEDASVLTIPKIMKKEV